MELKAVASKRRQNSCTEVRGAPISCKQGIEGLPICRGFHTPLVSADWEPLLLKSLRKRHSRLSRYSTRIESRRTSVCSCASWCCAWRGGGWCWDETHITHSVDLTKVALERESGFTP